MLVPALEVNYETWIESMEEKEQERIPRQMEVVPQEAEEAKALETAAEDR
ncbi:MAG: hypothetical protein HY438_00020 [DPANN group archaeon]|nr:hypothetical protein [DPANN group archaeon]